MEDADKIRQRLARIEKADMDGDKEWLFNTLTSLLPKPCKLCGGSGERLTSGFCNMIHKYIPCPACSQAPAVGVIEEFVKSAKFQIQEHAPNLYASLIHEACTHLTALLKQIEELEAKIEGQFHYKYCKVHKTIYCLEQGDCPLCLQAKIEELEGGARWIPVSERLPDVPPGPPNESTESIWLIFKGKPQIGYYTNFDGWRVCGIYFQKRLNQKDITHWKPIILPTDQAPKGGE